MLLLLQTLSGLVLAILVLMWGSWVYESYRPIDAPEKLGEVLVANEGQEASAVLSRAIAIGFVSTLDQFKRDVAIINRASEASGDPDITALTRVSQPVPSLLKVAAPQGSVDLKLEVVGQTVDAKGLDAVFRGLHRDRGLLEISLLLSDRDASGRRSGVASANFGANSAYGFTLAVSGTPEEISRQIALRYIQSHYAKGDPYLLDIASADFRTFWDLRRQVAVSTLQELKADAAAGKPDSDQAAGMLDALQPLLVRYQDWKDLQKLRAYLASTTGDFDQASAALQRVAQSTAPADRVELDKQIANLRIDSSVSRSAAKTVPRQPSTPTDPVLAQFGPSIVELSTAAGSAGRRVRIGLVLSHASDFPKFPGRIQNIQSRDSDPGAAAEAHADSVVGLLATLAPTAEIVVANVLDADLRASDLDVARGIADIAAQDPDIILVPLAVTRARVVRDALAAAAKKALVVLPAGNSGTQVEPLGLPGIVTVGASNRGALASYSGFGGGVDLYLPGQVVTYVSPTSLESRAGTTFSSTLAAAVAANLLAKSQKPLSPTDLRAQLLSLGTRQAGLLLYPPA